MAVPQDPSAERHNDVARPPRSLGLRAFFQTRQKDPGKLETCEKLMILLDPLGRKLDENLKIWELLVYVLFYFSGVAVGTNAMIGSSSAASFVKLLNDPARSRVNNSNHA